MLLWDHDNFNQFILIYIVIQFQLLCGDYFKEARFAQNTAEFATSLIGWLNNHSKVQKIYDASQAQVSQDCIGWIIILAYLVANLTQWTMHCLSFMWLNHIEEAITSAATQHHAAIICAQAGAAKSTQAELS